MDATDQQKSKGKKSRTPFTFLVEATSTTRQSFSFLPWKRALSLFRLSSDGQDGYEARTAHDESLQIPNPFEGLKRAFYEGREV
jgi:hypothetical protein